MPGLLRGMARVAVVAGTATAVSGRVQRRQQGRWAAKDEQAQQEQYAAQEPPPQQQPAYQQPEPAAADTGDMLTQLKQLGELKQSGVLTEAEFEAQKAKILAS